VAGVQEWQNETAFRVEAENRKQESESFGSSNVDRKGLKSLAIFATKRRTLRWMALVPEGRCDRSQARSDWGGANPKSRPVGYG
jgi:hypothetical protein